MKIEKRTIDWIPSGERYGKAKDLFNVWFSGSMHITTLVTGAFCITLGLNLFWSIVAIIIGNLIGAIFMASHSAQGPVLGVPQMIQSRAQFGVIGAILPLIIVLFMCLGFFASSSLLGAQTLSSSTSMSLTSSIVIMNVVTFIIALYGYALIHKIQKVLVPVFFIIYIIATIIVFRIPLPAEVWNPGDFKLSAFVISVATMATWQLAYAPYVADYSRYLPENTSKKSTFWYTYAGTVISSVWMMILGVFLTVAIPGYLNHSGANLAKLFGGFAFVLYAIIIIGQLSINGFNLYGAFMSAITTIEPFLKVNVSQKVRAIFIGIIAIIGTVIEIGGQGSFLTLFLNFIFFISYFLIPWTSLNLVDFYVLRKGKYNVKDLFDLNGIYGKVNYKAIISYIVAIIAQLPFMNTTFYVGPICKALDGADISWALGLIVSAGLYYVLMKQSKEDVCEIEERETKEASL